MALLENEGWNTLLWALVVVSFRRVHILGTFMCFNIEWHSSLLRSAEIYHVSLSATTGVKVWLSLGTKTTWLVGKYCGLELLFVKVRGPSSREF